METKTLTRFVWTDGDLHHFAQLSPTEVVDVDAAEEMINNRLCCKVTIDDTVRPCKILADGGDQIGVLHIVRDKVQFEAMEES